MRVLVINRDSLSLKLAVVEEGQGVVSLTLQRSLAMARMARVPHTPVVGCFDTAFHTETRQDLEIARETTRALRRDRIGATNP
jgi:acetate kinase